MIKAYPVKFELYDEEDENLIATFDRFDKDVMTVKIEEATISPEEFKHVAELYEKAKSMYSDGI